MRFLDRLISFLFDLVVIVLAFTVLLVMTKVVNYSVVEGLLKDYVFNFNYQIIVASIAVVVLLLGLKITVFTSTLSPDSKKVIFVDTPNGKIQINQDTIEGIAKNVIRDYEEIKDVHARMTKASKGINMYMVLQVYESANIKDIVTKVQNDVSSQITKTTSVEVKKVDVKIKNIVKGTPDKSVKIVKGNESAGENNPVSQERDYSDTNYIVKQESNEYLKDGNDVLYQVKSNDSSQNNIDIENINTDNV